MPNVTEDISRAQKVRSRYLHLFYTILYKKSTILIKIKNPRDKALVFVLVRRASPLRYDVACATGTHKPRDKPQTYIRVPLTDKQKNNQQKVWLFFCGPPSGTRTQDPLIKSFKKRGQRLKNVKKRGFLPLKIAVLKHKILKKSSIELSNKDTKILQVITYF